MLLAILERLAAGPELTGRIMDIIEHFHAGAADSIEARVLSDAHRLALAEEGKDEGVDSGGYLTETGGRLALRLGRAQASTA